MPPCLAKWRKPAAGFSVVSDSNQLFCMQAKTQIGITGKARETLAKILEHVLQEEFRLSATTRDYRWNVTGPQLYSLHRLFDEQRRQLDFWLNKVLERARSIGFGGRAKVRKTEAPTATEGAQGVRLPPRTMVGDLLTRHEEMAHRLRDDIERLADPGTAELLRHIAEFHETSAWVLRMVNHGPSSAERAI